jgi:hypothetical protein
MAVKKIKLGTVEANLRRISNSAEMIKKLQDQKEAAIREYGRERMRYKKGGITRSVLSSLTRSHKRRIAAINKRISALVAKSKKALGTASSLVTVSRATAKRKRRVKRREKAKKRRKKRVKRRKKRKKARKKPKRKVKRKKKAGRKKKR